MTNSAICLKSGLMMGSQNPSVRVVPKCEYSDGNDANKILSIGGLFTDAWQKNCLVDFMGFDGETWSASTCGLSVPRQNGKTCITAGRIVAGMILYGEWVIYTAHLQKTSSETFMEIKGLFENSGLNKHVKEIKNAIGREQIILKNGARVQFVARTRNGGRGLHGDLLVFDEAQELTPEQQASFLPLLSASQNPQTIYLGTPPDENCDGTVFKAIRSKAKTSENIAWTEFSVDKIGDISDKARWYASNPALGRRIRESTIQSEFEQMPADMFARERLGWWSNDIQKIDYAINRKKWESCMSEEEKPEGRTAYGIKFSADGSEVALSGAVIDENDIVRISMIKRESTNVGIRWLAEWLNERYRKACCVVIDGRNGTDLLIDRISDTWRVKGSIRKASTNDVISAASLLIDSVNDKKLTWYRYQDDLNDSAINSTKRKISTGFGFGGENPLPVEACALALLGVRTSKRDPNRKMRIG